MEDADYYEEEEELERESEEAKSEIPQDDKIPQDDYNHNENDNEPTLSARKISAALESNKPTENSKKPNRLTINQLSSLYRRLDVSGDGELDLSEFLSVAKKMKMSADPQFLSETFRKVDIHGTGKLTLPQFATAYNIIYDHDPDMDMVFKRIPSYVMACRYGLDKSNKCFIFEIYSGPMTNILHKTCYYEDGSSKRFDIDRTFKGKPPPSRVSTKSLDENQAKFDLSYLVSLIDADTLWNQSTGHNKYTHTLA